MKTATTKATIYTVRNTYGIAGESNHRTPEAALKKAAKREGSGWIVEDSNGNRWIDNGGVAMVYNY